MFGISKKDVQDMLEATNSKLNKRIDALEALLREKLSDPAKKPEPQAPKVGTRCPDCKRRPVQVLVSTQAMVVATLNAPGDASTATTPKTMFNDKSEATCMGCGYHGVVKDFYDLPEDKSQPACPEAARAAPKKRGRPRKSK